MDYSEEAHIYQLLDECSLGSHCSRAAVHPGCFLKLTVILKDLQAQEPPLTISDTAGSGLESWRIELLLYTEHAAQ